MKGKYSIVPYPACVGRLDRVLPGWTDRELAASIDLVRTLMMPNWDIHPEMVTHTRVIDTKTGHPYPDHSLEVHGELGLDHRPERRRDRGLHDVRAGILKNIGLPCEGITTPGGFGNRALARSLRRRRSVGARRVQGRDSALLPALSTTAATRASRRASNMRPGSTTADPRCVVSIIGCTGDWTGGWDNTPPGGRGQVHHCGPAARTDGGRDSARRTGAHARALDGHLLERPGDWDSRSSRKSCGGCTRASTICCG